MKISIPNPCHENWQQMTPNEKGHFCASCQKTVVDFSNWSDKAIFHFFEQNKGKTCGRFSSNQINRVISIQASKSRAVYRIAIALTAMSLFAQPPIVHAQRIATHQTQANKKPGAKQHSHINLQGTVTGKQNEPVANVTISLRDYRLKEIAYTTTDSAGRYTISNLKPDTYTIVITPHDTVYTNQSNNVIIKDNKPVTLNTELRLASDEENYLMGDVETGTPDMELKKK